MNMIQALALSQKLLEVRKSAQTIHGPRWRETLQPYMQVLEGLHKEKGIDYLPLGQQLAEEMQAQGISPFLVLAATVELIDPTPKVEVKP